jgi:hypothetical protein
MAKHRSPAQKAATARMLAANRARQVLHPFDYPKPRGRHPSSAMGRAIPARSAAAMVKAATDRAALEMRRAAAACKAEIKRVRKAAKKAGHKKPKHRKKAHKAHHAKHKVHHHKKAHHKAHKKHERTVTARQLLAGRRGHRGMKTWVCEAPVRTGCGGGARGGHVLGDLSKNTARRLRR